MELGLLAHLSAMFSVELASPAQTFTTPSERRQALTLTLTLGPCKTWPINYDKTYELIIDQRKS
jgi:phosphodiesterase/alkaline phosphatase D-like protein